MELSRSQVQVQQRNNSADSWYGVQDPRRRKRIQDRLAQRARRRRQSEIGKESYSDQALVVHRSDERSPSNVTTEEIDPDYSDMTLAMNFDTPFSISSSSSCSTTSSDSLQLCDPRYPLEPKLCDHRFLPDPKMTVIIALGINGSLLGLTCDTRNVAKTPPQPSSVPPSLHPTQLQLATPHYDWIDRLPSPRWRDNMIILYDLIDVKELFFDFFTMDSFTVKEGERAWDPKAWQISPEFYAKWGYLFYCEEPTLRG